MTLPTRANDPYKDVDTSNFSTAHTMSRENIALMASIAESRSDFDASGRWKAIQMELLVADAEQQNIAQAQGTPLREQPPAPQVPPSPTTFNRQDPASRMIDEPARPPEAATGADREWSNRGTRAHPDDALRAQAARNAQLMIEQERALRG